MHVKTVSAVAGLGLLLTAVGFAAPVLAQMPTPVGEGPSATPSGPPRLEVNPRPLLYRRCTDRYVIQYRPSGTVLFPEKHCWWVRG